MYTILRCRQFLSNLMSLRDEASCHLSPDKASKKSEEKQVSSEESLPNGYWGFGAVKARHGFLFPEGLFILFSLLNLYAPLLSDLKAVR